MVFEKNYCLKVRLGEQGEHIATVWHKNSSSGILYNVRQYNHYEAKYEDSLALIEVSDGYIGDNCYCNTTVCLSQKHSSLPGPYPSPFAASK